MRLVEQMKQCTGITYHACINEFPFMVIPIREMPKKGLEKWAGCLEVEGAPLTDATSYVLGFLQMEFQCGPGLSSSLQPLSTLAQSLGCSHREQLGLPEVCGKPLHGRDAEVPRRLL